MTGGDVAVRRLRFRDIYKTAICYRKQDYMAPFPLTWPVPIIVFSYFACSNILGRVFGRVRPQLRFLTLVAVDQNTETVVGLSYLRWQSAERAGLLIFVDAERQGEHIGDELLGELISQGSETDLTHIQLRTSKENRAAIGLYRKHSFQVVETLSVDRSYGNLKMERAL